MKKLFVSVPMKGRTEEEITIVPKNHRKKCSMIAFYLQ